MNGPFILTSFQKESLAKRELLFWWRRDKSQLSLRYQLSPIHGVLWPQQQQQQHQHQRAFELWRTTCFELFLSKQNKKEYIELNFSPSSEWDAYIFEDYRTPISPKRLDSIRVEFSNIELGRIEIEVELPQEWMQEKLEANVTAVIQDNINIDYYAIKHASGRPDFHKRELFALELNQL